MFANNISSCIFNQYLLFAYSGAMYAFKLNIYDIFKFQGVMVQDVIENGFITVLEQLGSFCEILTKS